MHRFFDKLERMLLFLAVCATLLMLAILGAQVVMRYVFSMPLSWSEEIAMLLFTWVIMLSTVVGIRRCTHARMALLVEALPQALQSAWERAIDLLIMGTGVFIAYSGWDYLVETRGSTSPAIGYPIEWLYACAPCFGVLLILFTLERIIDRNGIRDE
ncbi:TRAP transporter small permease [Alcaligenaceae bacterium]|nr:TRAP transporter small permease [Alcaligenaceae bacterium]